jgi:hypothetical protein
MSIFVVAVWPGSEESKGRIDSVMREFVIDQERGILHYAAAQNGHPTNACSASSDPLAANVTRSIFFCTGNDLLAQHAPITALRWLALRTDNPSSALCVVHVAQHAVAILQFFFEGQSHKLVRTFTA